MLSHFYSISFKVSSQSLDGPIHSRSFTDYISVRDLMFYRIPDIYGTFMKWMYLKFEFHHYPRGAIFYLSCADCNAMFKVS